MQAKKKVVEVRSADDLGLATELLDQPKLVWEGLELPAERAGAKMIDGDASSAARELARLLRDEAKVI